ncbi:RNA 2',3'-cyclic phosphodiesterase [Lysinibacillus telephonicus]|uniref:RNA 2',3'-cyclic phosphodiesterase n=1 Tax=Lysinibacillus telephonicus TaxID=1714840 RepID=A0A431UQN6_9BACI|nr:RNA 2',3'-cyclic phosphodiesterase [Lysinibacillus telephonicus]RTQ92483.1 RNA 2',3'-cyclic phosphodiesterase [Lysinibacillus telephonicus]
MALKNHYFFAVKLPGEVKSFLNEWVEINKEAFPFKKWVHPEDYHITLAFLGFVEESMLKNSIEKIKEVLAGENSFTLTLNEIGTFGAAKSPRIFWTDVQKSEVLMELQKKVYESCVKMGFELDKKPFRPHITLARKWKSEQPFHQDNLTLIRTNEGKLFSFTVSEIALYESHVESSPKYKEIAIFPLMPKE